MRQWSRRIMFDAPCWAVFLNAYFLPRRALFQAMKEFGPALTGHVLDVGCGEQPYRSLLGTSHVTGLELDTPENRASKNANVFYDGTAFPFPDAYFQGVLCNQVLEHVFNPDGFLAETFRVLQPTGRLVLSVPFVWPEHEQPWDCMRYTSFGLRDRLESAGFELQHQRKLAGGGAAVCALIADQLNRRARPMPLFLRILLRALLIAPVSLLGWGLQALAGRDPDFYLDNFIVAIKPERG